ncbi:hypothetical protein SPRA44_160003 [Serratia proteamaculans]|nr:hypothetical protein SPRA44_160003 [Serratia proteamaculans]
MLHIANQVTFEPGSQYRVEVIPTARTVQLRAGGGYTWHRFDTSCSVNYGMQSDRETAKYRARTEQVFAEAGYSVKVDWVNLEPFANLAFLIVCISRRRC